MPNAKRIYYQKQSADSVQTEINHEVMKNQKTNPPSQPCVTVGRTILKASRKRKLVTEPSSTSQPVPEERVIKKARRRKKAKGKPEPTMETGNQSSKGVSPTLPPPKSPVPLVKAIDSENMDMDIDHVFVQLEGKDIKNLVIDTNVILKCTKLLEKVQGSLLRNWQLKVVIPYKVVEELDQLKSSKKVGGQAQAAIRWCNNHFELENSDVEGQSLSEFQAVCNINGSTSADDLIRDTCLYYQTLQRKVTLITDDINLRNKALLSKIDTLSSKNLSHVAENVSGPCKILSQKKTQTVKPENNIDRSFGNAKEALVRTLSAILEHYMKDAFGSFWKDIIIEKPPWNVPKLIKCYKKHWIAIFIVDFNVQMQKHIDKALEDFSHPSNMKSDSTKNKAVRNVEILLAALEKTAAKNHINPIEEVPIQEESSQDMECEMSDSVPVMTSSFENVKKAILRILKQSHRIVNQSVECLAKNKGNSPTVEVASALSSLKTLQKFLKEFGFSILGLMNNPSLSGAEIFGNLLVLFWNEAQLPNQDQFTLEEISHLVTSHDGTEFLRSYITELEKLIQSCDQNFA